MRRPAILGAANEELEALYRYSEQFSGKLAAVEAAAEESSRQKGLCWTGRSVNAKAKLL